jgi:predicted glycoside hydrolase/deacetylase ChbG (UPF0249 family)
MSLLWREKYGNQFFGLPKLIQLAYTRQLDLAVVVAEVQTQLNTFIHDRGVYPDFIDGHQHVHQFPVIHKALLKVYQDQKNANENFKCFLRKTYNGWQDFFSILDTHKTLLLAILGGARCQQIFSENQIPTNSSFAGLYNFKSSSHFAYYFKRFLKKIKNNGLIMCHPGYESKDPLDAIYLSRHHEFTYFMSDEFLSDLSESSVTLKQRNS